MNGKDLMDWAVRSVGGIDPTDKFMMFQLLNESAADFVRETKCLLGSAVITTVADQQEYELPPDFLEFGVYSKWRRTVAKYETAAGRVTQPVAVPFAQIFEDGTTDARETPSVFALSENAGAKYDALEWTAAADVSPLHGVCILNDDAAPWGNIIAGDEVQNVTAGSTGRVTAVASSSGVNVALFNGDRQNVLNGDVLVFTPRPRPKLTLDAPSKNAGDTLTVPYLKSPRPVYSDFLWWEFGDRSCRAVAYEAAFRFIADYDLSQEADNYLHVRFLEEISRRKRETARNVLAGRTMGRGMRRWR